MCSRLAFDILIAEDLLVCEDILSVVIIIIPVRHLVLSGHKICYCLLIWGHTTSRYSCQLVI